MKTSPKRIAILILFSSLLAIFASSCGTMHGFGKDVHRAGDGIQRAAH
jgi:predicted small secreted protein